MPKTDFDIDLGNQKIIPKATEDEISGLLHEILFRLSDCGQAKLWNSNKIYTNKRTQGLCLIYIYIYIYIYAHTKVHTHTHTHTHIYIYILSKQWVGLQNCSRCVLTP